MTKTATTLVSNSHDYAVADIKLADYGRKEIAIAETEMPGLDVDPQPNMRSSSRSRARASPAPCT